MHGNRSPTGRGGGRASAALPLLDDVTTSPASRRLASARPALAPKCQLILARALSLLGHVEVYKMVKFPLRNPKLEFRNPKQIRNPNFQITKMHRLEAGAF